MPDTAQTIESVATVIAIVEPIVAPEIYLVMGLIRAYQNAHAGKFPTPEEVQRVYDGTLNSIKSVWANWTPTGT